MDFEGKVHPVVEETARDVASMEIRGAAPIARAVAEALETAATGSDATGAALRDELERSARVLYETRPTAVSLSNALRAVLGDLDGGSSEAEGVDLASDVAERARTFVADLADAQAAVGRAGAERIRDGDVVLTHCHSSAAMACIEHALDQGRSISVIVKETRPRMQGHGTARHLTALDVPVTFVVDSAAHAALTDVDLVLVGADTIAADGSVVNKIGTAGLAASAAHVGVPLLVAATTVKLNPASLSGEAVSIEERSPDEVVDPETRADIGNPDVWNPAFDRTPPEHVDAIATESGIVTPDEVEALLRDRYGVDPPRPWA